MIDYIVWIAIGYLVGSVPFGVIAGKLLKNVDVREFGSGKTGMTNVLRTVGPKAAAVVLVLDMSKAVATIAVARYLFDVTAGVEAAAGLAALVGHSWPVFIGFRGGRGTATGWAGLFILSPIAGLIATVIGLPAVALTRYVSLGSLLGASIGGLALAVMAFVGVGVDHQEYAWYGVIGGLLVVIRHRDNIGRLIRGEERKLGQKA